MTVGTGTVGLNVVAGPYLRIEGVGISLGVAGQTLTGDFAFEQVSRSVGSNKVVRIAATNVNLTLGSGTTAFVSLTEGQGVFVATAVGMAGSFSGAVQVNVPGVVLGAALTVEFNTAAQAINETMVVGGTSVQISLPAGSFLRIVGSGVSLDVMGQKLKGDFTFERKTVSGQPVVELKVANVYIGLGDGTTDFVSVSGDGGVLTIDATGMVGSFVGKISANIPQVTFNGNFTVDVKIDRVTTANRYVKVTGTGVSLLVAGQTLSGNFVLEQITAASGARSVSVGVTGLAMKIGEGSTDYITLANGQGILLMNAAGLAASFNVNPTINIPELF